MNIVSDYFGYFPKNEVASNGHLSIMSGVLSTCLVGCHPDIVESTPANNYAGYQMTFTSYYSRFLLYSSPSKPPEGASAPPVAISSSSGAANQLPVDSSLLPVSTGADGALPVTSAPADDEGSLPGCPSYSAEVSGTPAYIDDEVKSFAAPDLSPCCGGDHDMHVGPLIVHYPWQSSSPTMHATNGVLPVEPCLDNTTCTDTVESQLSSTDDLQEFAALPTLSREKENDETFPDVPDVTSSLNDAQMNHNVSPSCAVPDQPYSEASVSSLCSDILNNVVEISFISESNLSIINPGCAKSALGDKAAMLCSSASSLKEESSAPKSDTCHSAECENLKTCTFEENDKPDESIPGEVQIDDVMNSSQTSESCSNASAPCREKVGISNTVRSFLAFVFHLTFIVAIFSCIVFPCLYDGSDCIVTDLTSAKFAENTDFYPYGFTEPDCNGNQTNYSPSSQEIYSIFSIPDLHIANEMSTFARVIDLMSIKLVVLNFFLAFRQSEYCPITESVYQHPEGVDLGSSYFSLGNGECKRAPYALHDACVFSFIHEIAFTEVVLLCIPLLILAIILILIYFMLNCKFCLSYFVDFVEIQAKYFCSLSGGKLFNVFSNFRTSDHHHYNSTRTSDGLVKPPLLSNALGPGVNKMEVYHNESASTASSVQKKVLQLSLLVNLILLFYLAYPYDIH